jgi:predicted Rossmann fold flavoprotein
MRSFDVIVLGAGAAGMMAAIEAGKRGRSVLVIDHARAPGEKIRISGGGRCNFTNVNATAALARERFLSANPRFALSALARYAPQHFIGLVRSYGIAFHEKTLGQLFCDGSSVQIVNLLTSELGKAGAALELGAEVETVDRRDGGFHLRLSTGDVTARSLVLATGGKSIPKMGATGLAYRLAEQFGLAVTETRPALVPLTFEPRILERLAPLAGISTEAVVAAGKAKFREALLFTHRGLSGPAILQISSYWREGDPITVTLLPDTDVPALLKSARTATPQAAGADAGRGHRPAGDDRRLLGQKDRDGRGCADPLDAEADRHRRLPHRRGDPGRRRHRRARFDHDGGQSRARPLCRRRGGGRHRMARRLQFPVGLGQRLGGRAGGLGRGRPEKPLRPRPERPTAALAVMERLGYRGRQPATRRRRRMHMCPFCLPGGVMAAR